MNGYRFVLDTSAVLAYDGSTSAIHVGELIAEAALEHRMVAVPTLCLAEAMRTVTKPEQQAHLRILLTLDNVCLVQLPRPTLESCQDFANWTEELDGVDRAAAAMAATDYADDDEPDAVYVVTAGGGYGEGVPVVEPG